MWLPSTAWRRREKGGAWETEQWRAERAQIRGPRHPSVTGTGVIRMRRNLTIARDGSTRVGPGEELGLGGKPVSPRILQGMGTGWTLQQLTVLQKEGVNMTDTHMHTDM